MLLTISGLPGSGTTTISRLVSEYYRVEVISSGEIFRQLARERGLSLSEFGAMAEADPAIDLEIDKNQKEIAHSYDDIILESRLAGHMAEGVPDVIKVCIKAPRLLRVKRIQKREKVTSFDEVLEKTMEREKSETLRYKKYYDIDIDDLSIYDIVIDSSKWNPYQTLNILKVAIDSFGGF